MKKGKYMIACSVATAISYSIILLFESNTENKEGHVRWPSHHQQQSFAKCDQNPNIVYVKTHKTGSTSLMNILGKFSRDKGGIRARGFPASKYGGYPAPFNASFVYYKPKGKATSYTTFKDGVKPNYLLGHMKFNKDEVQRLMPTNSKYVTIVRDPVNQIPSTFNFYYATSQKRCSLFGCHCSPFVELFHGERQKSLENFLAMPLQHVNGSLPLYFKATNFQSFDLGLDSLNMDPKYLEFETKELDDVFDLVLVTEHLDESLILMKELLCMKTEDILYEFKNTKSYDKPKYTEEVLSNMKKFYHQDFYIYEYFNRTLWEKVDKFGRLRMEIELEKFRKLQRKLTKRNAPIKQTNKIPLKSVKPYSYSHTDAHMFKNIQNKAEELFVRLKYDKRTAVDMQNIPLGFDIVGYTKYVAKYYNICKIEKE